MSTRNKSKPPGADPNKEYSNPYKFHAPILLRWRGSVIPKVLPASIFMTLVATAVTCIHILADVKLSLEPTLIPVLGLVVGLLLTYRTNTAYDRYWEGRKLWGTLFVSIRNLARLVWVHVKEDDPVQQVSEKKSVINLLLGFAVATKHYLREEPGTFYNDLKPLIPTIRAREGRFLDQEAEAKRASLDRSFLSWFGGKRKPHQRGRHEGSTVPNLPLEISLYIGSYLATCSERKQVDAPTFAAMNSALSSMIDCLTHFERILRSPIPLAYSVHLTQTVWIYCLSLPFQFVGKIEWATIPMVGIASFILIGIENIGGEIENPFGYDENDLDLDDYCAHINAELASITSHKMIKVEEWVFTDENRPFGNNITAPEARKMSEEEVRSLLEPPEPETTTEEKPKEVVVPINEDDEHLNTSSPVLK